MAIQANHLAPNGAEIYSRGAKIRTDNPIAGIVRKKAIIQ
jgi:hypothetical protein